MYIYYIYIITYKIHPVVKWGFCIATFVYLRVRVQWVCVFPLMPQVATWMVDKCCLDTCDQFTICYHMLPMQRSSEIGILVFPSPTWRPQKNHLRSTGMRLMYARAPMQRFRARYIKTPWRKQISTKFTQKVLEQFYLECLNGLNGEACFFLVVWPSILWFHHKIAQKGRHIEVKHRLESQWY